MQKLFSIYDIVLRILFSEQQCIHAPAINQALGFQSNYHKAENRLSDVKRYCVIRFSNLLYCP